MKLIKAPPAPLLIRLVSLLAALAVAAAIAWLVLNFGYYASGLAAFKEDQRRRERTPIQMTFGDPNAGDPNAPAPAPAPPRDPNAPGPS